MSATEVEGDQKVPRSTQWNLTIQRAVGFGTVVDLGYVGNLDRHAAGSRLFNPVPLFAYANPNNLFNGTEMNADLLRTNFPGMSSISYQCNCLSDLNYHGLQISANRRMSHGFQYGASYVFSKALGIGPASFFSTNSDPYHGDRSWYYGPLDQDRRQVFNLSWVYQIPSPSPGRTVKAVLGDWTLSGIARIQSGAPLSPTCMAVAGPVSVTDPTLSGLSARCKVVGDPKAFTQSFYTNFNTSAFALADPQTFGSAGVGILREPTTWNVDLTLDKHIPIGKSEARMLRLRIEAYNVFNHTEFNAIGATMMLAGATNLSTTYGQYTSTLPARVLSTTIRFDF